MSPTARSLQRMRKEGWKVCVVEKWIPQMRRRIDAYGFGDILGHRLGTTGATLVQSTTDSHLNARLDKILAIPEAKGWLRCGNRIETHGWGKKGARGKRKIWTLRCIEVTLEMFSNGD